MATALAPSSEATPAVDLFARALVAAQRMRMGTSERLRLESLRLTLHAKDVPSDDPRIAHWLAAALCTSREERAQFLQLCAVPGAALQLVERAADGEAPPPAPHRVEEIAAEGDAPPWWRRRSAIAAVVALALGLALVLAFLLSPTVEPPPVQDDLNMIAPDVIPTPQAAPSAEPSPMTTELRPSWIGIFLLTIPLLAAAGYIHAELRRRRELRRDFAPAPQRSLTLAFAAGPEGLLGDPLARRALRRLRRHRPVPSRALDVPATIEATIATGGRPDLQFSTRRESPEYLVMAERESPRDHLAWLGALLSARMREEQIATAHFEFLGDPRRLHRIERGVVREVESLTGVIARHDRANTLLMAESFECAARDAASDWIDTLALTESPALLDPRPRGDWDADELWLARRGVNAFAMSGAGLSAYADHLCGVPVATTAGNHQSVDLPTGFAKHRAVLVADTPPDPVIISGLVDDLEDWLDQAGFEWLCAVALFPYIDPGLTVHLGAVLTDRAGKPLLEEARFLRLARLPWMREGRMPDWLRTMLVRRLRPERLTAATAAIQAFLVPQADGATRIDLGLGEDAGWRAKLLEWLRRRPSSVLADRLLIDALADRPPDQLGMEVARPLRDRLAPLWADRALRAAVLALIAMIGIAVTVPPWRVVEVPVEAPVPPPDDGKSDMEAAADAPAAAADDAMTAADAAANAVADAAVAAAPMPAQAVGTAVTATAAARVAKTPTQAQQISVDIWYFFQNSGDHDAAEKLKSALEADGTPARLIGIRPGDLPRQAEVRYKLGQESQAASLASLAGRALGLPRALAVRQFAPGAAEYLGDNRLEIRLPRDGLSGSTGGGWGDSTKTPPAANMRPTLPAPSKEPIPQSLPTSPPADEAATSKEPPAASNAVLYRTTFFDDPPERGAISDVVERFRMAQKEVAGSSLDPEAVRVRIDRGDDARPGYDLDIARELTSQGLPAAAIYLGTTPYARSAAGLGDAARFGMMRIADARNAPLATVSVVGPRPVRPASKKY